MKKLIFFIIAGVISTGVFAQRYMEDSDVNLFYGAVKDTVKVKPLDTTKWYYDGFTIRIDKKNTESGFMFKKPMDVSQIKYFSLCPCNINPGTCPTGVYYWIYYTHIINESGVIKVITDSTMSKKPTGNNNDSISVSWKNVISIFVKQDGCKGYANCYIVDGCYFIMKIQGYAFDSTGFPALNHVVPTIKESAPLNVAIKSAVLKGVSFYPNPTTDIVNFTESVNKVDVIDINGNMVLSGSYTKQIDLSSLLPGSYILRITDSFGTITEEQVVKQ